MNEINAKKGKIVIISGPSGVGKSTITKKIVELIDEASLSVSVTTRPKSMTEKDGIDYWFISKEEFQKRIKNGMLLEYANVFGNMYGTPKDKVDEALEAGKIVILEIDVQGGKQVKAVYPDAIMIFILPPSDETLSERIENRGRDSSETIEKRLDGANAEIASAKQCYEYLVVNEDLQQAIDECVQIIQQLKTKNIIS
ncbi:MAG: guanylate kinase [Sedimentisphaerales bacterium]|nr:guanylate kinase [Sedimentisphaerales bacterium]